ncbi:MAG: hypothetical protein O3A10_16960 [Chloroflexi bacterium]|nr:hypothetical protein [Chloroflexota bacterium]MDA1148350.1 hypothetical protein [Chloroflexota bacterium]
MARTRTSPSWQDQHCTSNFQYRGGHAATTGVIYAPGAKVDITGGGDLGGIQVLADTVHLGGNANYTLDFHGYVGDSGTGALSITE